MNNPLGVSPSKGNQVTTRGKEKIFWPRWESNPRPPDPDRNGRSNPEVVGSIPTEVKRFFLYLVWLPDSLY